MTERILWVTDRYPPWKGGMAVSCERQVRGLRRRDVAVDVMLLQAPAEAREARDNGFDIHVPADVEPGAAWLEARELHARQPYSLVVGFGGAEGGFHAATFGAWLGVPVSVLVRGNDLDRDWFLPQRGWMVREAFARAGSIGAVTTEKADRIRSLFPGRHVAWTPNSVDADRWQLLPGDERRRQEVRGLLGGGRIVGLIGELKAKKRIPFWLEAVRDRELLSALRLLVVGNLDAPTSAILNDPAIAPRSLRLPFCAPGELAGLYAACDFIAIPSLYEGMPNVLLEAMACGVIPIASDAGGMRDVITDGVNGFLFPSESRDGAGDATARALALSDSELAAMSARVREDVRARFSPDRELDILLDLFRAARR